MQVQAPGEWAGVVRRGLVALTGGGAGGGGRGGVAGPSTPDGVVSYGLVDLWLSVVVVVVGVGRVIKK